jgi:hypothetical protein
MEMVARRRLFGRWLVGGGAVGDERKAQGECEKKGAVHGLKVS